MFALLFGWLLHVVMVDPVPIEVDPIPLDPFDPTVLDPAGTFDYPPSWLPDASESTIYTGSGVQPVWDDVYKWAEAKFNERYAGGFNISQDLRNQGGLDIGRTAIGAAVAAVSGFINRTVETMQSQFRDVYSTLQFVLGAMDQDNHARDVRIHNLQSEVNGLAQIVAAEEGQIVQLHDLIFQAVEFEGAYIQDWATRTILEPLFQAIINIGPETDRKILLSDANVLQQAHADTLTQLAPVTAVAAALAVKVAALTAESDTCVKPMCQTMGPNTPLGKLLKALEAAGLAALLVELAGLRADGLDGLIGDLGGWASKVIDEFESLFFTGGRTLGETLAGLPG